MSDFGEALGTAAEGGLFARAVSGKPSALTDKDGNPIAKGHFAEGTCLNCGTELIGEHCHACGQRAHLHRTIGAFLHDLLHGALHLDGKTWRTLPMLIRKPGELTRRYIDGERARFVSPMAMFLFSVFLMFAVFQAIGLTAPSGLSAPASSDETVAAVSETAGKFSATANRQILEARERIDAMPVGSPERIQAEEDWAAAREIVDGMTDAEKFAQGKQALGSFKGTGIKAIDDGLIRKWQENPGLMLYKLQANAYKFSWLLIPLSVPFVWLLFFWKRRFKAYDHAIFVTYSLAFISLLFITLSLIAALEFDGGWIFAGLVLIPPIHMYKQLKHTYGLGRLSTLWRLIVLLLFIVVVLLLFFQVLLLLGTF